MKNHSELQKAHKSVLRLVQEQVRKHSFGKLVFLSCVGPRSWEFAPNNVDYDYKGIYLSKEENTYNIFVSGASINRVRNISLISFERIIVSILRSDIDPLIFINSPAIYAGKEFLEFRKWANSNFSKQVYKVCQIKQNFGERRDYLDDFLFIGNSIAILEKKKVIPNLPKLNKRILKIPAIDEVIKEEELRLPFKSKQICKKIQRELKALLKEANKKSRLPGAVGSNKLSKLKIIKKINLYFWYWPDGGAISREKGKKKYEKTKKRKSL